MEHVHFGKHWNWLIVNKRLETYSPVFRLMPGILRASTFAHLPPAASEYEDDNDSTDISDMEEMIVGAYQGERYKTSHHTPELTPAHSYDDLLSTINAQKNASMAQEGEGFKTTKLGKLRRWFSKANLCDEEGLKPNWLDRLSCITIHAI